MAVNSVQKVGCDLHTVQEQVLECWTCWCVNFALCSVLDEDSAFQLLTKSVADIEELLSGRVDLLTEDL